MMKNLRRLPALLLVSSAFTLVGCGGGGALTAVAPGGQNEMIRQHAVGGQYTLYRGTGFDELNRPRRIEAVWQTQVTDRDRVGFEWYSDPTTKYEPKAALHLVAVAGSQRRDLGPLNRQNEKYFWAESGQNVAGYWQGQGARTMYEELTMQK
jgi:hypothetical protein